MHRCPTCHSELQEELVASGREGDFTQVWRCPNAQNHGTLVLCRNGCGTMVPNPDYHYSYTSGLIGSGRWSCVFPLPRRCHEIIERPVPKDPPGIRTIRMQGDLLCNKVLPCPEHGGAQ